MDIVLPAIGARLDGDTELTTTLRASVWMDRQPDDPSTLKLPVVVYTMFGNPDTDGRHGGATDPEIEVHVWGYETWATANRVICWRVATRIDELLLAPLTLSGGAACRIHATTGFEKVDDTDPRSIHLVNRYSMRYWAQGRIAQLTS